MVAWYLTSPSPTGMVITVETDAAVSDGVCGLLCIARNATWLLPFMPASLRLIGAYHHGFCLSSGLKILLGRSLKTTTSDLDPTVARGTKRYLMTCSENNAEGGSPSHPRNSYNTMR